jgi:hypothetical protein
MITDGIPHLKVDMEALKAFNDGLTEAVSRPADRGPTPEELNYINANRENPKQVHGDAKVQLQLLSPYFKEEVALVMSHGAAKYGAWNWRETEIKLTTYIGAIQRHIDAWQKGEDFDPDSNLLHIAHAAACINVVIDAAACNVLIDDRPAEPDDDPEGLDAAWEALHEAIDAEEEEPDNGFDWDYAKACTRTGFLYMLSPYSKYEHGTQEAAEMAAWAAGKLLEQDIVVHSPIAETHAVAAAAGLEQTDHRFWLARDERFMNSSKGAVVLTMDGWEDSFGMKWELAWYEKTNKPVFYLDPSELT